MMMTSLVCDKYNMDFATVHDSYWTHACNALSLRVRNRRYRRDEPAASRAVREALFAAHFGELLGVARHSLSRPDLPQNPGEGPLGSAPYFRKSLLFQLAPRVCSKMSALSRVVSELDASIVEKIHEIEGSGDCFLKCFVQFSDEDVSRIVSNASFAKYIRDVIMESKEETEVEKGEGIHAVGVAKRHVIAILLCGIVQPRHPMLCRFNNAVRAVCVFESLRSANDNSLF